MWGFRCSLGRLLLYLQAAAVACREVYVHRTVYYINSSSILRYLLGV